jgi:guanyl-specific ribonuclease Sa
VRAALRRLYRGPNRLPLLILFLGVLLVIGTAGWLLFRPQPAQAPLSSAATASSSPAAPPIRAAKDLNTAQQTLDSSDPTASNNNDLTELSNQASSF